MEYTYRYQLPHNIPQAEGLIALANAAHKQASDSLAALDTNIGINNDIKQAILQQLPEDKAVYATAVLESSRAVCASVECAITAANSEKEAMASLLKLFHSNISLLKEQQQSLENTITNQMEQAQQLRADLSLMEAYGDESDNRKEKAARLLSVLEASYSNYRELKECKNELARTNECFEYTLPLFNEICGQLQELEAKRESIEIDMEQSNIFFGITPKDPQDMTDDNEQGGNNKKKRRGGDSEEKVSLGSIIFSYVKIFIFAVLLAFLIRAYVLDVTQVKGLSMYGNLNENDMIVTSKISYTLDEPERGDIVVFDAPDSVGEDYVKRIIGLPKEEIIIQQGLVYINGERLSEPYLDGVYTDGEVKMVIPDGFYFVMGDNRSISRDSRNTNVGVISRDAIHGKAIFRIFPLSDFGTLE